jgi:hypothetical protein
MSDSSFSDGSKDRKKSADQSCTTDSEDLPVTNRDSENNSIEQNINADESVKPLSEEEGLNAAKDFLEGNEEEREDKELATLLRHLVKCRKKARELGAEGLFSTTTIYNQGGNNFSGCDVSAQNIVGHDQKVSQHNYQDQSKQKDSAAIDSILNRKDRYNYKNKYFFLKKWQIFLAAILSLLYSALYN